MNRSIDTAYTDQSCVFARCESIRRFKRELTRINTFCYSQSHMYFLVVLLKTHTVLLQITHSSENDTTASNRENRAIAM